MYGLPPQSLRTTLLTGASVVVLMHAARPDGWPAFNIVGATITKETV